MHQINWHLGQTLLPEHFNLAQTHGMKQSIEIAQATCPTKYYGLADLDIDAYLLTKNILKIKSLFYVKASGDCIHFQANDQTEPLELNLNMLETDAATISLQIDKEPLLEFIKISTQDIQLKFPKLSLSVNSNEVDELHCIKLLTLQKYEDGTWELCEDLPPLLNTSPYSFKIVANALYTLIHVVTAYIKHECGSNSALAGVKFMQLQNVELALQKLKLCLSQLKQNKQHPYSIYQYLCDIYLNLMQYKSDLELSDALVYDHAHPWKSFETILNTIRGCVQYTHSVEYKPFNLVGNILTTGTIDYEVLNRKKHYLIIRKPAIDYSYNLSSIKITSPERAEYVHKYAIVGLKLKKLTYNPLPESGIDNHCDVYEMLPSREWDYIFSEQNLSILKTKDLNELKFTYYYI